MCAQTIFEILSIKIIILFSHIQSMQVEEDSDQLWDIYRHARMTDYFRLLRICDKNKIPCLYVLFTWSRYLTLVPLDSNWWFIIIVSDLKIKPVLPYRQTLKKVQTSPPLNFSQHIYPGKWNAAGPNINVYQACERIKLVTLVVYASVGCTSKAYIGYYTWFTVD